MFEILKKNFFTYLIIIFFTLFKFSESYIVLPFKINYPKIFDNITKVFNELLDNKLMITLPFGIMIFLNQIHIISKKAKLLIIKQKLFQLFS